MDDKNMDEEYKSENEMQYDPESDQESDQEYENKPIKLPEIDYSKMFKEVKILNNIKTYITYINSDNEIEIINQKKIYLNNDDNIVTRNQLIEVIKNSQKKT